MRALIISLILLTAVEVNAESGAADTQPAASTGAEALSTPFPDSSGGERDRPTGQKEVPCPASCNKYGYSSPNCRSWQEGDKCYIGPREAAQKQPDYNPHP